jgi:hypothetical protein
VADPEHALFPDPALPAEAGIDAVVAARRGESAADTLAAYEAVSAKAVDAFAGLQEPGLAEAPMPPPGYVPYQTAYARWSFSYPGADFSAASVSMSSAGANLPVRLEPVVSGYGENTLVWIPSGLSNAAGGPDPRGTPSIQSPCGMS